MILTLLALALQPAAPSAPDVTVTGRRAPDPAEACRAGCTVRQDVTASVAFAERQFMDGGYLAAKRTLEAAAGRQRARTSQDPVAMGTLYAALATAAAHDGDLETYRQAVGAQARAVRAHLPAGHPAVANAEMALATMWTKLGQFAQAERAYTGIARKAAAGGRERLSLLAGMRAAWLADAAGSRTRARTMLAALERRPGADEAEMAKALKIVRMRLAGESADEAELEKLAAEIARDPPARPVLVSAPPPPVAPRDAIRAANFKFDPTDPFRGLPINERTMWADIGFRIRPDGGVGEMQVLRGKGQRAWFGELVRGIKRRRYAPSAAAADPAGVYKVERFTWRATYEVPKGSRVPQRAGSGATESLDVTERPDDAAPRRIR